MASIDVLKNALRANGLPTSGNKDQMLQRLLSGQPDKRKGKPVKAEPAVIDATADDDDDAYETFAAKERSSLMAQGFSDEQLIAAEIKRRYTTIQLMKTKPKPVDKPKTPTKPTSGDSEPVMLPSKLSDEHAVMANLVFVTEAADGRFMYLKSPKPKSPASKPSPAASSSKSGGKKRAIDEVAAAEPEPEERVIDEATFDQAVDIVSMRLFKKANIGKMVALLQDYGLNEFKESSDKSEVARNLAEQLCYETDDEREE